MFNRTFIFVTLILAFPHFSHAVVVTIVNDMSNSDSGSLLEVSSIKGVGVKPSLKFRVAPGQSKRISVRHIQQFSVTRIFGDYRKKYVVSCPNISRRSRVKASMRIVDVQNDTMPAGCKLLRSGTWSSLKGMVWDQ